MTARSLKSFYSTGIRRTELCHLRIDDIQVDRQSLFVSQGKGNKDRYVPIGMRALLWIARYVEQARDRLLLDEKGADVVRDQPRRTTESRYVDRVRSSLHPVGGNQQTGRVPHLSPYDGHA